MWRFSFDCSSHDTWLIVNLFWSTIHSTQSESGNHILHQPWKIHNVSNQQTEIALKFQTHFHGQYSMRAGLCHGYTGRTWKVFRRSCAVYVGVFSSDYVCSNPTFSLCAPPDGLKYLMLWNSLHLRCRHPTKSLSTLPIMVFTSPITSRQYKACSSLLSNVQCT